MPRALITGITGQDGSYLAELLLKKGYQVHGIRRRRSSTMLERIHNLYYGDPGKQKKFILHYGDMTDSPGIIQIVQEVEPDEIYNLAAQSDVRVSFDTPEYTANTNALGVLRLLEAVRLSGLIEKIKFYQASTSEMYGNTKEFPQNEKTSFKPRSPYGHAKLYAHGLVGNYREAYGIFACCGILFNHESERRGENFVTRKITQAAVRISRGKQKCLSLGNLYSKRDWGYAKEYVDAMWRMLQQDKPQDFVIATGETHTVKEFVELVFKEVNIEIDWTGKGLKERGIDRISGKTIIVIDPYFFRPTEVDVLCGDSSKAKKELNWEPKVKFEELVKIMMKKELEDLE